MHQQWPSAAAKSESAVFAVADVPLPFTHPLMPASLVTRPKSQGWALPSLPCQYMPRVPVLPSNRGRGSGGPVSGGLQHLPGIAEVCHVFPVHPLLPLQSPFCPCPFLCLLPDPLTSPPPPAAPSSFRLMASRCMYPIMQCAIMKCSVLACVQSEEGRASKLTCCRGFAFTVLESLSFPC